MRAIGGNCLSASGPLRTLPGVRSWGDVSASRQAGSGRGSCWGGLRFAPTALRCSVRGRVAKLASFAALTALRHCDESDDEARWRAPTPALRFSALQAAPGQWPGPSPGTDSPLDCPCPGSAPQKSPLPEPACRSCTGGGGRREQPLPAAAGCLGGARRACEAPSSAGFMARARSAPRDLTWRICLSAANEVSAASYAPGHGPEQRRAVGAPAETASVARRAPSGHPVAATTARTRESMADVRNGPQADKRRSYAPQVRPGVRRQAKAMT
jgi:hypothetical protein